MGLWSRCNKSKFVKDDLKCCSNPLSDDNQTSLAIYTRLNEQQVMETSMGSIHAITISCTFEPSVRKNFISKFQKEFIYQMNVAGQQKSFWVKTVMSMVSGSPTPQ